MTRRFRNFITLEKLQIFGGTGTDSFSYLGTCVQKSGPSPPNILNFSKVIKFPNRFVNSLPTGSQPLFNLFANSNYAYFIIFGAKAPNMVIRSQTSKILENFETYNIFRIVSPIHFQRALNGFSIYLQTRIMPILVFWAANAQIWIFCPKPPNF